MFALRLVRLIEAHSDPLARGLVDKILTSERTRSFQRVPRVELEERAREIYRNLSDWLVRKTETELERLYTDIGQRRAAQGVEFPDLLWGLILTKEHTLDYLQSEVITDSWVELFGEFELLRLLEQFFDRALYYAAVGYRSARPLTKTAEAPLGQMATFVP